MPLDDRAFGISRDVTTAALPRSTQHIALLVENEAEPDLVLFRDAYLKAPIEHAFPGRGFWLGRETRPRFRPGSLIAARRDNRRYYRAVRHSIDWGAIRRLILFLEGEPLERFILGLTPAAAIELWEDGLSHYIDLTTDAWYRRRAAAQLIAGFHRGGIFQRRLDRTSLVVRDRFEAGNLRYPAPPTPLHRSRSFLLVGSPLVDDGLISSAKMIEAMATIATRSPLPIWYIPHPREDRGRLRQMLPAAVRVVAEGERLAEHVGQIGYSGYLSALSTGLLDIARPANSLFIPGLFGLKRAHDALAAWPARPVALAHTAQALTDMLNAMAEADRR